MKTVYVLNGPSLNLLGTGDPAINGSVTLADVERGLRSRAAEAHTDIVFLQTNHEGDLVDWIHEAAAAKAPIILNAGAYGQTSLALHDAIRAAGARVIVVQLSNPPVDDTGRHPAGIAPLGEGVITGFGTRSYDLALQALLPTDKKQSD